MNIPLEVNEIITTLYKNGYTAFMVGGCVRDSLLGLTPKDYDITTNALPGKITKLFSKTIPTGLKHGTITVIMNDIPFEVTTYRIDGEYKDNRRPENVEFISNVKEDLARRDFTINAMAYNNQDGLIDYFEGKKDLKLKVIKCVGDPNKRFNEDALRMLRAIRFSCQLNFDIHKETFESIKVNYKLIENISAERVKDELCKILLSSSPSEGLRLLESSGILKIILPELQTCVGFDQKTPYHNKDIFEHTLGVIDKIPPKLHLRLAALFHDIGKPLCFFTDEKGVGHFYGHNNKGEELSKTILKRLKFDNETITKVTKLVKEHMNVLDSPKDATLKRMINRVGKDLILDLFTIQRADILSSAPPFKCLEKVEFMEQRTSEILSSNTPLNSKELAVDGNDLMRELNLKPGKTLGAILSYLLDKVLEDSSLNNKETLIYLAKQYHAIKDKQL